VIEVVALEASLRAHEDLLLVFSDRSEQDCPVVGFSLRLWHPLGDRTQLTVAAKCLHATEGVLEAEALLDLLPNAVQIILDLVGAHDVIFSELRGIGHCRNEARSHHPLLLLLVDWL